MAFEILQLPKDPDGIRSHVEQYKAFRLLSLQTDPDSFGSSYEREIAFSEDIWYNRLANPDAVTLVALQSGCIVCTITILGPLPFSPEELSPTVNPWELKGGATQSRSHWRINGMFTLPQARGQGIAKALIKKGLEYASTQAARSGKPFVASLVVDNDNLAAKALYEKCGFSTIKEDPFSRRGQNVAVLLMKFTPEAQEASD